MSVPAPNIATLLVASDDANDAALVVKLLGDEFGNVLTSTNPNKAAKDFDLQKPDVLVLAFNVLEKSERYNLGLYRQSEEIHRRFHRTIVLCSKEEVRRAYEFCRNGLFDDYVVFWPLTTDAPRLLMTVHHALRELANHKVGGLTPADFATQARHLVELEPLLDRQMANGALHIEEAGQAIEDAENEIDTTLEGLSRRITHYAGSVKEAGELEKEITRLRRGEIHQRFRIAAKSVQPLKQWAHELKQACAPHLKSARVLGAMSEQVRPTVLVVDDDELQRKIVGQILGNEKYRCIFAADGVEVLSVLRKERPDLILMDIMMPDMDGLEATRHVKAVSQFAAIPIIMITGMSEKNVVVDALKMGVTDFVVKPFIREILIAKVTQALKDPAPPH
jgi:CheY-like chemotaxis protein